MIGRGHRAQRLEVHRSQEKHSQTAEERHRGCRIKTDVAEKRQSDVRRVGGDREGDDDVYDRAGQERSPHDRHAGDVQVVRCLSELTTSPRQRTDAPQRAHATKTVEDHRPESGGGRHPLVRALLCEQAREAHVRNDEDARK